MRLIDADALLKHKSDHETISTHLIWNAPTVDAVPVIRCKDCKWYDMTDSSGTVEPIGYRCKKVNRLWREPDDFCKGAERKDGYVTLHHDDIHFIDEDAERAFYEALTERRNDEAD